MVFQHWKEVLVKWVNCLGLSDVSRVGEISLDTFFQEISTYFKLATYGKTYDSIAAFLRNEFPDFDFDHRLIPPGHCNETEPTYMLSVLLFHCSLQEDNCDLRNVMCQRLNVSCQESVKHFISHLYGKRITKRNIEAAICAIETNLNASSPNELSSTLESRSSLNAAFSSPTCQLRKSFHECSSQLKRIKLERESEELENLELNNLLRTEKEKTKNLHAQLEEKRNIIAKLREDLSSSHEEMPCPYEGQSYVERSLRGEIKSMKMYISNLQNEMDPIREELDSLKRQLARAQHCSKVWQQRTKDVVLDLGQVSLELQDKATKLEALQEQYREQEKHIRDTTRCEFNRSIESDEYNPSPVTTVESVPFSHTVLAMQLNDMEAEVAEGNQHIRDEVKEIKTLFEDNCSVIRFLEERVKILLSKLHKCDKRLRASMSDLHFLALSKLAVEKELTNVRSVLQLRDSDISKYRDEIQSLLASCSSLQDDKRAAYEKQDALQHEIDELSSENKKINDELQNARLALTGTMKTLDDTLAEKAAALKRAVEIETLQNSETIARTELEVQLADVKANLQGETLTLSTAMLENKVLADFLVKSRDLVHQLKELISCLHENKLDKISLGESALTDESESLGIVLPIEIQYRSVYSSLAQSLSEKDLPKVSLILKLCQTEPEYNVSPLTPVFKELHSMLVSVTHDVVKSFSAMRSLEAELSESNAKLQFSMCQKSKLEELMQEKEDKEKEVQTEINELRKCNEVLEEKLGVEAKERDLLTRAIYASNLCRDELTFQLAALKLRNEKLCSTLKDELTSNFSGERKNWESINLKKKINSQYRNILSSRRLVEQKFYDVCIGIQEVKAVYSVDGIDKVAQLELEVDNILDYVEDQNTKIHAELLNTIFEYVKRSKYDTELPALEAGHEGEAPHLLFQRYAIPDLQARIEKLQEKLNSTKNALESTCTKVTSNSVDLENSLKVKFLGAVSKKCLLGKKVERLAAIQNHSNQLYNALGNTKNISPSFKCSHSALLSRLMHLKSANKILFDENNAALQVISSLKLCRTQQVKEETRLQKAYLNPNDENNQVREDLAKVNALLPAKEEENQLLEKELKFHYTRADFLAKCDLLRKEYDAELQSVKQKMNTKYKDEMAKIEPVKQENKRLELLCKEYEDQIFWYKEYKENASVEMKSLKDELQREVMDKELLQQQVATLRLRHQALEISSRREEKQMVHSNIYQTQQELVLTQTQTRVQRIINEDRALPERDTDREKLYETDQRRLAELQYRNAKRALPDGEESYETDQRRLAELQCRNAKCLPHLKSCYPSETLTRDLKDLTEDDLKLGFAIENVASSSPSLLLPKERHRKKDRGQAAEPSTPKPLREQNENGANRTGPRPLHRFRNLFSSKTRRNSENSPVTPRPQKMSFFRN